MDKIEHTVEERQETAELAARTNPIEIEIEVLPAYELALMQQCGDSESPNT